MTQDQINAKKALKELSTAMHELYDMNERILSELVKQDAELRQLRHAVFGTSYIENMADMSDEDKEFWDQVLKDEPAVETMDAFTEKFNKQQ